jgi:CheY-like chemotaxis protein
MNLVMNASESLEDNQGMVSIAAGQLECSRDDLRMTVLGDEVPQGRYVWLCVKDTGCGMDEDTRLRMFDPFFSTKFTGRGLGMAAVLGIVRGHRGAIRVDTAPGSGTSVTVYLPASPKPLPAQQGGVPAQGSRWRGSGTVLVVDDEQVVRALATHMLSKIGFEVLTAAHGDEALKAMRERGKEIVVVLLDMTMPVLGGMETYEMIRKMGFTTPVAFSSGYNKEEEIRLMDDRRVAFVQKPYQLDMLRARIRELLADSGAEPGAAGA